MLFRSSPIRRAIVAASLTLAAFFATGASTPVIPTAPIIDFRLPVFNEEGFRIWELRGSEALYLPAEQRVEIKGLHLKIYSGDDREIMQNEVESPLAIALINERTVSGPGLIRMTGAERMREFEVRGEDWTYQETLGGPDKKEKTKTVVIRKAVVVTFSEDIGSILR